MAYFLKVTSGQKEPTVHYVDLEKVCWVTAEMGEGDGWPQSVSVFFPGEAVLRLDHEDAVRQFMHAWEEFVRLTHPRVTST